VEQRVLGLGKWKLSLLFHKVSSRAWDEQRKDCALFHIDIIVLWCHLTVKIPSIQGLIFLFSWLNNKIFVWNRKFLVKTALVIYKWDKRIGKSPFWTEASICLPSQTFATNSRFINQASQSKSNAQTKWEKSKLECVVRGATGRGRILFRRWTAD
jgi:hypothetical protein